MKHGRCSLGLEVVDRAQVAPSSPYLSVAFQSKVDRRRSVLCPLASGRYSLGIVLHLFLQLFLGQREQIGGQMEIAFRLVQRLP
jgi:hypothetical protein